ncbi:hypothetical protein DPMN_017418 [Dreissena polymorpha]|uniref:Uncharacterized protein n=1 Tax=Dreissena polymorpha TaxID=45954 RepID=A0A9D4NBC4_DREPO|nr:hypothetical protein DPMN_017418 [Dreissena polymorpha]
MDSAFYDIGFWAEINLGYSLISAGILALVPKPTMTNRAIINSLTNFHKDWMKTVTSTVYTNKLLTINILTKFHKDWMKTATSIINILTKFHKDWMKTVTSTVYTNKLLTDARTHARTHNGRRTSHGHNSSPCHFMTGELKRALA